MAHDMGIYCIYLPDEQEFYGIYYLELPIYTISKLPNAFLCYFAQFHLNRFLEKICWR